MDFRVAVDKLASLDSADEIADFLRSQNARGAKLDATSCVITNWLTDQTGLSDIITTPQEISRRNFDYSVVWDVLATTEAIRDFIGKFDNGKYADLVEPAQLEMKIIVEAYDGDYI